MFTMLCDLVLFILVGGLVVYAVLEIITMRREMKCGKSTKAYRGRSYKTL